MLLPIVYLLAAHLYRDHSAARPLVWVSHAATGVMLVSSLASASEGFGLVQQQPLNLILALFFAEAAVFYALTAGLRGQVAGVPLGAAMACAAVWQLFAYAGVEPEVYTLVFAVVGLGLLVAYRLSLVERIGGDPMALVAFFSGNVLLSLSFAAAVLMTLSRLVAGAVISWGFVGLCLALTLLSLLAVALVRDTAWRRWYVVTTIGQAALSFLCLTTLSTLSPMQKLEVFSVGVGLLLLVVSHLGWYREQERENDLVTLGLALGSLMVGVPLAIATLADRSRDHFLIANELGFLAAGVILLTSGFLFRIKATTLIGGMLTALYFLTLLIFVPWGRLNAIALFLTIGGGTLFGLGLVLSVYRDRLLTLPERIRRREGVFRVLGWR
jgi:hypothetical protein